MGLMLDRLIAIVLALTSFSIKPNPKADKADVLLAYAVPDAELIVQYDAKPIIGDNLPVLMALPDSKLFARLPGPRAEIEQVLDVLRAADPMMKQQAGFGIDVAANMNSLVFVDVGDRDGDPMRFLYVGRSRLTREEMAKMMTTMLGATEQMSDGVPAYRTPDGNLAAYSHDGLMLFGHDRWVRERVARGWKAPARPAGSPLAQVAAALDQRPFFMIASIPSAGTVARARSEADLAGFPLDLYAGHEVAVLWGTSTGISWTYQATDAAMAARVKVASEGLVEILRSLHLMPRAGIQLAAAALPSYAGKDKTLDTLIAAQDEVMAALDGASGSGTFTAKVKLTGKRVSVELRGKKVSDVVPASTLFTLGAWAYLMKQAEDKAAP